MVAGSGRRWSALTAMWRCTCVLALLCAALLRCSALKRAEMSPMPFMLSSRYGRSPPRMLMPRSDRLEFVMGARYGKRSEMSVGDAAGGGGPWRRACDCEHLARRLQTCSLFKQRMRSPERVSAED